MNFKTNFEYFIDVFFWFEYSFFDRSFPNLCDGKYPGVLTGILFDFNLVVFESNLQNGAFLYGILWRNLKDIAAVDKI